MIDIASATHVAFDTPTTQRLMSLGAAHVVRAADNLVLGPSYTDSLEHARARRLWGRVLAQDEPEEEWDELHLSTALPRRPPVVVWASASLPDCLNLWRACAWAQGADVRIIELEPRYGASLAFNCADSVADHEDEVLLTRLSRARPWSRARFARAVELWRRFTSADPIGFARRCAREAPRLWGLLTMFFPRLSAGGLRLSRFDEVLLSLLSEVWQTPAAVFAHDASAEWIALTCCTGDLWVAARLEQWAVYGAVERRAGSKPGTRMLSHVYRLTPQGARLLLGLGELAAAPAFPIGGAVVYGGSWALRDGRLARLGR